MKPRTPPPQPILRTGQLAAQGWSPPEIRARVKKGELVVLQRGFYVRGPVPASDLDVLRAKAAWLAAGADTIVSHATAAVCLGLPVRRAAAAKVHFTRTTGSPQLRSTVHIHKAKLVEEEITTWFGMRVTTVARTLIDLGRTEECRWAVVSMDAALHRGQITLQDLQEQLLRHPKVAGLRGARRAMLLADSLNESPGESLCRIAFHESGIEPPQLQKRIDDKDGFVGRVDFCWPDRMVILEFDGREKYFANARAGQSPSDVLWAEKKREDRLRRLGYAIVRVVWDDILRRPEWVCAQVREKFVEQAKRV